MDARTAIDALVLLVLAIDLLLTAGIIRRLREPGSRDIDVRRATSPVPGFTVDIGKDEGRWDPAATAMLTGVALVAFVVPGCIGCERLRQEIDTLTQLPAPLFVVGDPVATASPEGLRYLESWSAATARLIAPTRLDALVSFDGPNEFPTVLLLDGARVVASGHRLREVLPAVAQGPTDARSTAR